MTVLLFLVVLVLIILVHEWGHFIVAKKTGMRVDEFGIGFPPKVFGYKWGETEYTLNALPIGGFVRIFGENFEEKFSPVAELVSDDRSERSEAGRGGQNFEEKFSPVAGIDGDSQSTQEEVVQRLSESDGARAFSARPKWAQALVLIAGVAMNILFAWFLFVLAFMAGVPAAADPENPGENAVLSIIAVLPNSPADEANIPAGATVYSLATEEDTLTSPSPTSFKEFIVSNADQPIELEYGKGDEVFTTTLNPTAGLVAEDSERAAVGVSLAYTEVRKESFLNALFYGLDATISSLVAITKGLATLLGQTFTGTADFSQVAGPIGIAGLVGDAAEFGFTSLMLFTAMISLNLAVINLLPIPALDGGRLVFVAIEAVTKKEIPPVWAMRVNLVGFAFLMLLMIAVTYGDVMKLL